MFAQSICNVRTNILGCCSGVCPTRNIIHFMMPCYINVCFFHYCALLWCAQIIKYIMVRWSYSFVFHITLHHYHHYADVFEGMLVKYILPRVCLRLSKLSQLSFIHYMLLCVFNLPIYLMVIVRIRAPYLIIIIKSEVWPICHCLGLSHEISLCAVCIFIFSSLSFGNYSVHDNFKSDNLRSTHKIYITIILGKTHCNYFEYLSLDRKHWTFTINSPKFQRGHHKT